MFAIYLCAGKESIVFTIIFTRVMYLFVVHIYHLRAFYVPYTVYPRNGKGFCRETWQMVDFWFSLIDVDYVSSSRVGFILMRARSIIDNLHLD